VQHFLSTTTSTTTTNTTVFVTCDNAGRLSLNFLEREEK
jgi:hypothetical protein